MATIFVAGHITANAQQNLRHTANGDRYVTTFTVADNSNPNRPEYYRFSAWSANATRLASLATQGRAVACTGHDLKASVYTNRQGQPAASLDVVLDGITWMTANPNAAAAQPAAAPAPAEQVAIPDVMAVTDGLPF